MPLTELNHYFVRANDLEQTKKFYCDVLGFEVMPRPTFPFPGYWLGVNGKIQVHMGQDGIDHADLYYLGTPKGAVTDHAGVVDHIAFVATEPGGFIRRFKKETPGGLPRPGRLRFPQPKRWGGMELPFEAIFDLPAEIGRGCASTAWNVANLGIHHWMLALYDERAQEEVWGKNPESLIASGIAYPQGRGRRVDGGFVVSGFWNFSSGVDVSDWNMLAVMVRDGERVVDHRMCLVPRGEYEVVDDWHVLGMRSTGSKSVKTSELFVPEHRALSMYLARGGNEFPGASVTTNPLFRVPLSALGSHCLAGAGVGNAQAALELTIDAIKERSTNYTGMRMRDFQAVQLRVARAAAMLY